MQPAQARIRTVASTRIRRKGKIAMPPFKKNEALLCLPTKAWLDRYIWVSERAPQEPVIGVPSMPLVQCFNALLMKAAQDSQATALLT